MNYQFENIFTQKSYIAGFKGSCRNIYGGFIAKIFMYLPYAIALLFSLQFANLIPKLLLENEKDTYRFAEILVPLLFLCFVILISIIWIKLYLPFMSRVISHKTGLPWKDYEQSIKINENGITIAIPNIKTSISWNAIDRVIDRHGFVYFYYGQFANIIPWTAFTDDNQRQEFIGYCKIKIEQ
jgi:YcxB-like protein